MTTGRDDEDREHQDQDSEPTTQAPDDARPDGMNLSDERDEDEVQEVDSRDDHGTP